MKREDWFGPKRIGYGIRPTGWRGWTAVGVLILVGLVAIAVLSD